MKKVFVLFTLLLCSSLTAQVKIWKQTTTTDFSAGTFDRVVSTTVSDGELQLSHPLTQVGKDTLDSSIPRFVSYDDAGNYLQGWISSKKVFVQKFNGQRQPISNAINVNENARAEGSMVGVALLNDGRFAVGWVELIDSTGNSLRYCQFYDALNAKVGNNIRIFNVYNATHSIARPIADQINQRFLFIGTEGNSMKEFQSYAWLYSPSGIKLRDSIKIVPSIVTKNEFQIYGICHNGKFAFVWSGGDVNYGPYDSYFMISDSNGKPLMTPVIANENSSKGDSPIATFDDSGNCCVIWSIHAYVIPGPPGKIHGQGFDFSGRKIGGLIQLTNFQSGDANWKDISWVNGMFRMTYGLDFHNGQPEQQWASYWKIMSITSGNFISGIFDAGSQQTNYQKISWNGNTPSGTRLKFQLRSSTTKEDIQSASWIGPSSVSDYYTNASGENINATINVKRFLQMKAFFETDTNGMTPVLNDVGISYMSTDTSAPAPVSNVTMRGEHRRIVIDWKKSPSSDVKTYRIYRAIGVRNFNSESFIALPAQTVSYIDSSVSYDSTYRYGITAVDSTFNESMMMQTEHIFPKTMKIFVSPSGSAQGDGTSSKPFSKIKEGIDFSFKGDTVFVLPGEYTEDVVMKEGIALIGSGASTTKIISSNSNGAVLTASHTTVQGFTFQVARGIVVKGSYSTISENILIHQGSGFDVGIFPGSYEHIVISKNILMNFSIGIQAVGMPNPPLSPIMIRNNIIYGSTGVQNVFSNLNFVNNTFIVAGSGVAISVGIGSTAIMNNCFAGYPSQGGYVRSVLKPQLGSFQLEYNNRWNFNGDMADTLSSTNISVDPLFINVAKNNYHLGNGSLCINAGNSLPEYNDKDGTRNDIGAYGGPYPLPEYMTFALATELSLKGRTGFPGDTVSVDVILSKAAGVKKADIEIQFDKNVTTFIDAATTSLTNGFSVTVHGSQAGKRSIHLEGASEISSGSGTIATLRFKLNPSVSGELHSAVEIGGAEILDGGNNRIVLSSIASGLIVIKSPASFPHRIFVDGSYSGISDGTIFHPYTTIQLGISNAKDSDTVFVAAGMYIGPISMKSNVYVKGSGAAVTTIICPNDPLISIPTVVRFKNVQNTGIYGCTLINETIGSVVEVMSSDADIAMNKIDQSGMAIVSVMVSSGSRVTIRDNYFIESKYGGFVMISLGSDSAIIFRNIFSPTSAQEVISLGANARATITNNGFHLSKEMMTGITGLKSKRSLVANNLFVGSASAGFGMKLFDAESTYVLNNIFDVRKTGIDEKSGSQFILNNVFLGSAVGVNVASSTTHRYNLFSKNSIDVNNGNLDATEISSDPQFIDQEKGNYHPAAMSILRDAGDPASQWNDKNGTRNDIGIFGGPYADTSMFVSANIRLRIGSVSGTPGDTVTIPIIASGILGMSGMQLMIEFDSQRLQLLNVHTTASTRSFSMVQKNIGQSIVTVEMNGSGSVVIDSAAVMELTMLVLPQATGSAFVKFQNVYVMSGVAQMISVQNAENGIVDLTPLSMRGEGVSVPEAFSLAQNYPNPFNPTTTIEYQLSVNTRVTLKVYNILGQEVATLVDGEQKAGYYNMRWDATRFASGVYIYRIATKDFVRTKKMLLLK